MLDNTEGTIEKDNPEKLVSLDCPFSLSLRYSFTFILSYVLCTLCGLFLSIVLFYCPFGII
jgi:hypothetical protein